MSEKIHPSLHVRTAQQLNDLRDYAKESENLLSTLSNKRFDNKKAADTNSSRDNADRDYARVLYSSAFRRLQDKMQLFPPHKGRFHRNRLTHSLEVAQIARSIAKEAGMKDTLTVQTCALAHDIGNPPFGHNGEKILNGLILNRGFEGNAQTFRVLTLLEEKHYKLFGLNLTWRTLLGVVKYPNNKQMNPNKFLYEEDYESIKKISDKYHLNLSQKNRTIDAEIMDHADEIAYAAHDLQDAIKQGYFTIDELLHEFRISKEYYQSYEIFKKIVDDAREFSEKTRKYDSSEAYFSIFPKKLTSLIVDTLINDIGIKNSQLSYLNYSNLALGLKKLTFHAVSRKREIRQYELLGEKVLKGLFRVYTDTKYNLYGKLLPIDYCNGYENLTYSKEGIVENEEMLQVAVCDYLAGMMDSFAIEQYEKYFGKGASEQLYFN